MIFQTFFRWTLCVALILASKSFGERSYLGDEEIDVLEPNDMAKRERSGFKTFKQTKRDKEILPEIRCGLYPKIVPVQNGDGNVRNDPQFVMVNRCQGACDQGLAWQNCTATKWRSIDVIVTNLHSGNPTRPVIEHEACECQCHVRCNDQIHERDVNNCRCNCKTRCKVDENQILDTCECVPRAGKRNVLY